MLLIAGAYAGAGYAGQLIAIPPGNVTAVWAPSGIALGALIANASALLGPESPASPATALAVGAIIAAGSTSEPLLGAHLLGRLTGRRDPLERAADAFALAAACVTSCLVGATIGVTCLAVSGPLGWGDYAYTWWTWWLGDTAGALIIAPLLLVWRAPPPWLRDRQLRVEVVGWLLSLLGAAQLIFGDWPLDPALLRIALVNLLANAVKYTAPRPQAHIAIRAAPGADGEQIIAISDDGVGFDMQYADQLFGVFRRLHRDDEFEGAGIGLATVRRVIHRHGGRVWAAGRPDHGATFYFTMKGANDGVGQQDDPTGGG